MYSDSKGISSYYDSYTQQDQLKRRNNSRFDHKSPHQKGNLSKTLRWNIEESKENILTAQEHRYPSLAPQLSRTESNAFSSSLYNTPKGKDRAFTDYSKSKFSKSYKAIRNQFDSEYDLSKKLTPITNDHKLYENKVRKNDLTISLGYKTNVNDLLCNYKPDNSKTNDRLYEQPSRTLKPSKSQKRINYDLQQPKLDLNLERYKIQLAQKSCKKIQDYLAEIKITRKEEKDRPIIMNNKSSKHIIEQLDRSKVDKVASTFEYSTYQYQDNKLRKYQTIDNKTLSTRQIDQKTKMSIHDFQLGSCKGQGAFGQVFPAIHKATNMLVAIKKVPKEKVKYMLDQFINEIKIQMFLDHPNIVKLYGFFDDSLHFYIVMEYMEGGNLFNLIKKKKKLTETETAERLKQICLGLKEMHDNSILHRDIKPQNIVLTNDVCKLCDFGWSAICKDRRTTYCGTLDYVSPQLIEGEGYDDCVDIWCIGVLCYEMICGKTPFYNISRKQTMKKIANVAYQYPVEITSKSKGFIDRILKKNPEDRMGIDEVLKDRFLTH